MFSVGCTQRCTVVRIVGVRSHLTRAAFPEPGELYQGRNRCAVLPKLLVARAYRSRCGEVKADSWCSAVTRRTSNKDARSEAVAVASSTKRTECNA
jgi:hypothetical protein